MRPMEAKGCRAWRMAMVSMPPNKALRSKRWLDEWDLKSWLCGLYDAMASSQEQPAFGQPLSVMKTKTIGRRRVSA